MLLSYNELVKLVEDGVIDAPIENINAASIDITLDDVIMLEDEPRFAGVIDLAKKQSINMREQRLGEHGYLMSPGEFILASSRETFNLPSDIACEYKLKSTLARNGLNHALAGWADPSWYGSKLTLELQNITRKHDLILRPGMKIGQIIFMKCEPVPEHASYAVRGQYNRQSQVTASKGLA